MNAISITELITTEEVKASGTINVSTDKVWSLVSYVNKLDEFDLYKQQLIVLPRVRMLDPF